MKFAPYAGRIIICLYNLLLAYKLAHFLDEFLLGTLGIAVVLRHDVALAVAYYHVGDSLHAKRALEVAVGVEQHVILPTMVVDKRLHLI